MVFWVGPSFCFAAKIKQPLKDVKQNNVELNIMTNENKDKSI